MQSVQSTPRYRRFPGNTSTVADHPPGVPTLLFNEKERERDPEEECFMCRQAHVYVQPVGMKQEPTDSRHRRHIPPLTRAQIEQLTRKKELTKRDVRKLLQCYFPEIKGIKYFQLHKYHSCCYDPKHLNLCKNHITALQREREQHPHHKHGQHQHDEDHYKAYEREGGQGQHNRVSFVRIKIEPYKGIPTRFLGPTALPEPLAEMLIKQVNRLENRKTPQSTVSSQSNSIPPYNVRRLDNSLNDNSTHVSVHLDNLDTEDDDETSDDEDEIPVVKMDTNGRTSGFESKVMNGSHMNFETKLYDFPGIKGPKPKLRTAASTPHKNNGDLIVEDLDELNRLYIHRQEGMTSDEEQKPMTTTPKKRKTKKTKKKKHSHVHDIPKLNHWEKLALEQSKNEVCGCRHHVMRREADQVIYDWCRCKDHQHTELRERRKSMAFPVPIEPPPPPPPVVPTPLPPKTPKTPKPPKVQQKSIGINATEPTTTEFALAYDPSAVDYDMIQEVIYYRTSSGRLIKPEVSNAFTYDSMPQSMALHRQETPKKKAEVLYMLPNGELQSFEGGKRQRGKNTDARSPDDSLFLTNGGSMYNGQVFIDDKLSSSRNGFRGSMPMLKLPTTTTSSLGHANGDGNNQFYQPAEFTLATITPDKAVGTPTSRRTPLQSPTADSQGRSRTVSMSMQKSSKPTYVNQEPTPDYVGESNVVAQRRWFDQPLGDQNLLPVHDGRYGLIAGTSAETYDQNTRLPDNAYAEPRPRRDGNNCTIS